MVVSRRLLLTVASALSLLIAAAAPAAAAYKEVAPSPLRQAGLLRVKDIAANGATNKGAIVAVGWHEASEPGQLYLAFSTDGGKDYRRTNGNLRQYRVVGDPKLGMSLAICAGKVWVGSTFRDASSGATRVFLTSRTIGGGASQAFVTPGDGRRVRDVSVACVGNKLVAIGWLEKKAGESRARLVLRSTESAAVDPAIEKKYKFGPAQFKGGIAVAATPAAALVAWVDDGNLQLKRFEVDAEDASNVTSDPPSTVAWRDVKGPQMAARGQRVALAYSDAGKAKAKLSRDLGVSFGAVNVLARPGSLQAPSRVYSSDVVGDRIVFEIGANMKGTLTPTRIQSTDGGESWGERTFGHIGARMGALLKKKGKSPLLMEAWHNNGPKPTADTFRAKYETP